MRSRGKDLEDLRQEVSLVMRLVGECRTPLGTPQGAPHAAHDAASSTRRARSAAGTASRASAAGGGMGGGGGGGGGGRSATSSRGSVGGSVQSVRAEEDTAGGRADAWGRREFSGDGDGGVESVTKRERSWEPVCGPRGGGVGRDDAREANTDPSRYDDFDEV
jgi:hypothetical protein